MQYKVSSCYNYCSLQLLTIITFVPHLCILYPELFVHEYVLLYYDTYSK